MDHPTPCPATAPAAKRRGGSIVAAALALPGVMHAPAAHAENAPEQGVVALKMLHYEDSQPGLKRITVNSPSFFVLAPMSAKWSLEASAVVDTLSGATPRWHTAISGASRMSEERKAGDVKITRYHERSSWSVGLSHSAEHDYVSNAVSLSATFSSDDNNRTWNVGIGAARDRINPTGGGFLGNVADERKRTTDFMVGVTQALSPRDIVQVNLTHSRGAGYFSDPYKFLDSRPRERQQTALLGRWNHHFEDWGTTLRGSYRYYRDSYGIRAHTLQGEWVQPAGERVTVTPLVRLYSQSAATFYYDAIYDPVQGEPIPLGVDPNNPPLYSSLDQRLAAFGALTLGLKVEFRLDPLWTIDGKLERYRQKSNWRLGGQGSPNLDTFDATSMQLGVSRKF